MATCNCMGPQNGAPLCPCMMGAFPAAQPQSLVHFQPTVYFADPPPPIKFLKLQDPYAWHSAAELID